MKFVHSIGRGGAATSLESHFHYWIDHNGDKDARVGSYIFGFLGGRLPSALSINVP